MRWSLGVDTGGTYTDAVLFDEGRSRAGAASDGVVATAKALTTHGDLSQGIAGAIGAVLAKAPIAADQVSLASLSTTLATNALVEGRGERAGLVAIGFARKDLERAGLTEALGDGPLICVAGGHSSGGAAQAPLDEGALRAGLGAALRDNPVRGLAVAAQFATRNPEHEIAARALIEAETGVPVTCSHELTAKLGGPRRALTSVLNARLIGLLTRLIEATRTVLRSAGVTAPLMVVRGDGALMSADLALSRPIETILSGPAASLVGAAALTGLSDALVSDIGGTTTDIALLREGLPRLDPEGATVGEWRTLVDAVAMRTHGLGGDSLVGLDLSGETVRLTLGPQRAVPISLLAQDRAGLVHDALRRQAAGLRVAPEAGRFLVLAEGAGIRNHPAGEPLVTELRDRLSAGPVPLDDLAGERALFRAAHTMVRRAECRIAALTPSDAAHVLGWHDAWDVEAASAAADLFARQKDRRGMAIAADGRALAALIVETLTRRSAEALVTAAAAEDDYEMAEGLAQSTLAEAALAGRRGVLVPRLTLSVPVIGLGASASTYYPAVAERLGAEAAIPVHAGVANAVGAVVGQVRGQAETIVLPSDDGSFVLRIGEGQERYLDLESATAAGIAWITDAARTRALAAGASAVTVHHGQEDRTATVEGNDVLIERHLSATATGRPARAGEGG